MTELSRAGYATLACSVAFGVSALALLALLDAPVTTNWFALLSLLGWLLLCIVHVQPTSSHN